MLRRVRTRDDQALLERVRKADPCARLDQAPLEARQLLDRVLAASAEQDGSGRPARRRYRTALLVSIGAAGLLVPAAVGVHRQFFDALDTKAEVPTIYDLTGAWTTTLTGLEPARLNGRWTITFTPYRNVPQFRGAYALTRNGRPVAAGALHFTYSPVGPMINVMDMSGPGQCKERIIGGNYLFELRGKTLTFEHFEDGCTKRRAVLASHTFRHR